MKPGATFREISWPGAGRKPAPTPSPNALGCSAEGAGDRLTGFVGDAELVLDRQLLRGFEAQDGDGRERLRSD